MKRAKTKVQRLLRLNAFREERADNALRLATSEQARAKDERDAAAKEVDRVAAWKSVASGDRLDLAVYGVALDLEQVAVERSASLEAELRKREASTDKARESLAQASRATRVSDQRGRREARKIEAEQEKRTFDQLSDLWLSHREKAS